MTARSPWTPLHAELHRTLRQRQLLPRDRNVLIAVSGGQDSVCLLRLLLDLQPKWGWRLAIAHCDHRWPTDAGMADFVAALADRWQVPFWVREAAENLPETEAAARAWRYEALREMAESGDFEFLVTAHTQSDRAETFLYNLLRGAGADGLQALAWQRSLAPNLTLVRPLLGVTRDRTGAFCAARGLPIWEDPVNRELRYARNRIRLELMPYLRDRFNPGVEKQVAQTAELLRADVEYLEAAAAVWLERAIAPDEPYPKCDRQILREAPLALQRRALRQFLKTYLGVAARFDEVEKLRSLLEAPQRSRTDPFPGGAIAIVAENWICWQKRERGVGSGERG